MNTLNYIPLGIGRLSSNQSAHRKTRTDFLEIRTSTNQVDTKTRTLIQYDYNSTTLRNMKPAEQTIADIHNDDPGADTGWPLA